jgi:teichuronic acid biosynthesis glycosyltransferase TuaC
MTAPAVNHDALTSDRRDLHILTLTPFYPTDRDDASGCFVAEPLAALAGMGIQNTVLAVEPIYRARSHANMGAPPAQWIRYFSLPGGIGLPAAGAFLYARVVGMVRELHQKNKIDLILAHAPLPCAHAAMLLRGELGISYVVTVHGLDAFSTVQVRGKAGEWCRRIAQHVFRSASRVICVSERVRQQVLEGAGANCRTSVVYNGVDPEMFKPAPSSDSSDSRNILSIGNLIPIKGHESLLRALAILTPEFSCVNWEIIGDGPERGRLQSLASEFKIAERIRFLGRQSRSQVAEALKRCTLFVLPSRYEGLGCVYLEAMAAGKPAIACRGQGIAEVIRDGWNGVLVDPGNDEGLAEAIADLLHDESRRQQMGEAARSTILQGFTLAQQAQNLARIYQECAA